MKNKVQLITYVDRFGGGCIQDLHALLCGPLHNVFGGVHLLPFFAPIDGADAGFDPIDHTQVDPRIGDWTDIQSLAQDIDVMADVIVNHISDRSPQFLDYLERGSASPFSGLFLTRETVFGASSTEAEMAAIYRPRLGAPFLERRLQTGEQVALWSTFTPRQLDIDVGHPEGKFYLSRILTILASSGVTMARLDAVGYAIKKRGTSCFMIPETFEFISQMAEVTSRLKLELLVEVHSYYKRQIEIAAHVSWVYDFALPPLILHAFAFGTAKYLKAWIRIRPRNSVTVLDTHDGIGIIDIGPDPADQHGSPGLVPTQDIGTLVEHIHDACGGESRRASGEAASNIDIYQVNCTFFDAMSRNERRYLLARAIQFFLPGVPQVYYVGLLAGSNDMELLALTGLGRDINRHRYNAEEIAAQLKRPVVQDLIALIRLRNEHPAFGGDFSLFETKDSNVTMRWTLRDQFAELRLDFPSSRYELHFSALKGEGRLIFAD